MGPKTLPVLPLTVLLLVLASGRGAAADRDTDGDGLSDIQETHKYRTDPTKKDTAGGGVLDGDPKQRREFTYSVRAVLRVMPPYNLKALNDDYQDVRVLAETREYVELEVISYPLNTNAAAIEANASWKKDYAGMTEYLAPGPTTNWDEAMRKEVLAELARTGFHPDRCTDKEVVEQVSRWLFSRAKHHNSFGTHFIHFPDGKPAVLPGLERAFQHNKAEAGWSDQEQFARELLGKEMFFNKCYGTCTSAAVAQATVLRAIGIPTRIIVAIPLVDASDPEQLKLAEKGLTHHQVRSTVLRGLAAADDSYAAHTFLEVFVGHRWRRLNYTTLGQNVLDPSYFGLMIHVHTFNDLSEAKLAPTWGARFALGTKDDVFRHRNPYRTVSLDDHFGKHAEVPNSPAKDHERLTIGRAYWAADPDAPAVVRNAASTAAAGSGRIFVHVEEWFDEAGDYLQYKPFLQKADPNFVLRAKGRPDIRCGYSGSFFTQASQKVREFELVIPPDQYAAMARGVAYTLHPVNAQTSHRWEVKDGLSVTRALTVEEKLDALIEKMERLEKRVRELEKKGR